MKHFLLIPALALLTLVAACTSGYSGASGVVQRSDIGTAGLRAAGDPYLGSVYQNELRAENSN